MMLCFRQLPFSASTNCVCPPLSQYSTVSTVFRQCCSCPTDPWHQNHQPHSFSH